MLVNSNNNRSKMVAAIILILCFYSKAILHNYLSLYHMENDIQRLVPPYNLRVVSFISTFIVTPIAIEQINILFKPDPTRPKLEQIRY